MNLEKFHSVISQVKKDLETTKSDKQIANVVNRLQEQINNPQQAQFQEQFVEALSALRESLRNSKINQLDDFNQKILIELGIGDYLGERLLEKIEGIFLKHQITPALAVAELQGLFEKVKLIKSSIDQILKSFEVFKIRMDDLESGVCELGIFVPKGFVQNKLDSFGKEVLELNKILNSFSELVTGSRPSFELLAISSSDYSVFVALVPKLAKCLAWTVEKIVGIYQKILEIKKLNKELKEKGVPETATVGIEEHANNLMENEIEKLVTDLMVARERIKKDTGRDSELSLELKFSMRKIANRIDKGFSMEFRASHLAEAEDASEEAVAQEEVYSEIDSVTQSLKFPKVTGEPVLSLPEGPEIKIIENNDGQSG